MRATDRLLLASAVLLFPVFTLAAEDPLIGEIRIASRDGAPYDDTFVRSFLSAEPGEPADPQTLSNDVRALLNSGRFTYADVSTEAQPDGTADITYTIQMRQRMIGEVTFDGLDAYTRLTELELRCRLEPEKGIFIAESAKVIERALAAGYEPVSFLLGEKWLEPLAPLLGAYEEGGAHPEVPVFVAPMELMEQLTGFKVTRGALCAMRRPVLEDPAELLARTQARRVAVLEGIVDHTNVGAIFRSAAALNVDAILVSPSCCDPLYRRAVRVSMGTVFQVPWTRAGSNVREWPRAGVDALHDAGFTCAALALTDESVSLDDPALQEMDKLALFLGTEGTGLAERTVRACDLAVRIPMAHGVDSLNVAAASAVAFWQLCPHVSNGYHYEKGLFS